jgi:hypothetical protein
MSEAGIKAATTMAFTVFDPEPNKPQVLLTPPSPHQHHHRFTFEQEDRTSCVRVDLVLADDLVTAPADLILTTTNTSPMPHTTDYIVTHPPLSSTVPLHTRQPQPPPPQNQPPPHSLSTHTASAHLD